MNYYLFTIEYDGTDFCGWSKQKNQLTIQGEIEKAIARVSPNSNFRIVGASKTDSGVHAEDQKAWVELDFKPNVIGFLNALNKALPIGIKIKKIENIKKEFRVRNCKEKTYNYLINLNSQNVFKNRFYYFANFEIDPKKLEESLQLFIGKHDFFNFSGLKKSEIDSIESIRTINDIKCEFQKDKIKIIFKAKGFIRYQIRMIIGASLAYCKNQVSFEEIQNVLELKKDKLRFIAKPEGLVLKKIKY